MSLSTMKKTPLKECSNCSAQSDALSCCGRCGLTQYCNRDCQSQHWKEGHKMTCLKPEDRRPHPVGCAVGPCCCICLGTEEGLFTADPACGVQMHSACLVGLYASRAGDFPPCPACRAPLPDVTHTLRRLSDEKKFTEALTICHGLPAHRYDLGTTLHAIHSVWGDFHAINGRFLEAKKEFMKALNLDKADSRMHESLADICFKCGELKMVMLHSDKAIELGSNNPNVYYLNGAVALQDFMQSNKDGNPTMWSKDCFYFRDELTRSWDMLCKAISLKPTPSAFIARALVSFLNGDPAAAEADAHSSIEARLAYADDATLVRGNGDVVVCNQNQHRAECLYTLARAINAQGDFARAEVEALKAVELYPSSSSNLMLAIIYNDWVDDDIANGRDCREHQASADRWMRATEMAAA